MKVVLNPLTLLNAKKLRMHPVFAAKLGDIPYCSHVGAAEPV